MMQEDVRLVELMIELVDARAPVSSRNPDIDEIGKGKSRILLLNKSDLADEKYNALWKEFFREKGFFVQEINARSGAGIKGILPLIQEACREKTERDRRRGIMNRPVRAMVTGIPNVGKSTFINSFAGKAAARTGNKPGVTKGKQWIRLNKNLELLDTPGILWPKFEDQKVGERLAMIGTINDEILQTEELAAAIITWLTRHCPGRLEERYGIAGNAAGEGQRSDQMLEKIAVSRRCFQKGETPDLVRASRILVDDFRSGKIGRITLEHPEELQ